MAGLTTNVGQGRMITVPKWLATSIIPASMMDDGEEEIKEDQLHVAPSGIIMADEDSVEDNTVMNIPIEKLDLIVLDYENFQDVSDGKDNAESKSVQRSFSKQKQTQIDDKIKSINEPITNILQYAFNMINDEKLNETLLKYKQNIVDHCDKNNIDTKKLSEMGRDEFIQVILDQYCKNKEDKIKLNSILNDVYFIIGQYKEYKELCDKLTPKQSNYCCKCDCNEAIVGPFNVYEKIIYSNKMILRWEISNKSIGNQRTKLMAVATEEELKYTELNTTEKQLEMRVLSNENTNEEKSKGTDTNGTLSIFFDGGKIMHSHQVEKAQVQLHYISL